MVKNHVYYFHGNVHIGGEVMGRTKGGHNRKWTNEERLKYVKMCEEDHLSVRAVARDENIPRDTLRGWIRRYREGGEAALNPEKMRSGNKFAALHKRKSLSEEERLKLLVEKLQIENERLKKGYIVKGVGAGKEFVTLKDLNTRSSMS